MSIADNLKAVQEKIAAAALASGRRPEDVKLIAVTKTVPAERVCEALAAGAERIGENRVQELLSKLPALGGVEAHLIGQLQSNKARMVVGKAACIHSVDRLSLAQELERCAAKQGVTQDILLEVNIGKDPAKGGVMPELLGELIAGVLALPHLRLCGLMTVPPICPPEEARGYFAGLRELRNGMQAQFPAADLSELSMGMSADYPEAVMEGATMVRVGSAIFGKREKILN